MPLATKFVVPTTIVLYISKEFYTIVSEELNKNCPDEELLNS